MDFEKRNNIYKIIMLMIFTAFITFVVTTYGVINYYIKNDNAKTEILSKNIDISDVSTKIDTKIELVKSYIDKYYLGEINEDKMLESAIKGYVDGLEDVYTEYLTQDEYNELMVDVNGNYVGIGIYMSQDKNENVVVLTPIEGSPAEEVGLKTGDIIVKVNGEEVKGKDLTLVSNKIKGEEGTTVELEILRDGKTFNEIITRRTVVINSVRAKVLDNNVGYIEILSFDGKCSEEFETKLNGLKEKNIESLIIDIRDNGGGRVDQVISIADLLVPKDKTLMITVNKEGKKEITKSKKDPIIDMDTVLLINGNSASASEILAGALKDNGVAKVVGTKTYGKGVMQEIVPIKSGGAMKITIEEFKTPNENTINKIGIEPDVVVELPKDSKEDLQLNKAIELLK